MEAQRLEVTDITLEYHKPVAKGCDVWNDPYLIPQNGNPIPWRAGANMNTTISFSSDVYVNGNKLGQSMYCFQVIPGNFEATIVSSLANTIGEL